MAAPSAADTAAGHHHHYPPNSSPLPPPHVRHRRRPLAVLTIFGVILLVVGLVLPEVVFEHYAAAMHIVRGGLVSDPASPQYVDWLESGTTDETATPVDYWLQHITNLQDVLRRGVAPIIEDKGPYHFLVYTKKYDVVVSGDEVTHRSLTGARYVPEKSCQRRLEDESQGNEKVNCVDASKDMISTVNPVRTNFRCGIHWLPPHPPRARLRLSAPHVHCS